MLFLLELTGPLKLVDALIFENINRIYALQVIAQKMRQSLDAIVFCDESLLHQRRQNLTIFS